MSEDFYLRLRLVIHFNYWFSLINIWKIMKSAVTISLKFKAVSCKLSDLQRHEILLFARAVLVDRWPKSSMNRQMISSPTVTYRSKRILYVSSLTKYLALHILSLLSMASAAIVVLFCPQYTEALSHSFALSAAVVTGIFQLCQRCCFRKKNPTPAWFELADENLQLLAPIPSLQWPHRDIIIL